MTRKWPSGVIRKIRWLNPKLERAAVVGACIILVMLNVVVFADVMSREFLQVTLIWASDVALFCFIWLAFLSASVGVRYSEHFSVDVMEMIVSHRSGIYRLTGFISSTVILSVGVIFLVWGMFYVKQTMGRFSFTLGLPIGYIAAIMPLSGALMILFEVERLIKRFGMEPDDD